MIKLASSILEIIRMMIIMLIFVIRRGYSWRWAWCLSERLL